jgi:hypothetical protein
MSETTICAICKHHSTLGDAGRSGVVYPFRYICDIPDFSAADRIDPVTGAQCQAVAVLCKKRNFGACPFWEKN